MIIWSIATLYLACILVVHYRGRVRHSFWGQVFDHSGLLAPVNVFLYAFSAVPNKPYISQTHFPELDALRDHADVIREEGLALMAHARMRAPDGKDDAGFNSFAKAGWKRFYLKWYGDAHPSALRLCPRTTALLRGIPNVSGAMFATLPPGAVLNPHKDPYAGSMRYHLGLVTPNDDACYIVVDGQPYSWRDGEGVIFDETFIHTPDTVLRCGQAHALRFRAQFQPVVRTQRGGRREFSQRARRPHRPDQSPVLPVAQRGPVAAPFQGLEPHGLQARKGGARAGPGGRVDPAWHAAHVPPRDIDQGECTRARHGRSRTRDGVVDELSEWHERRDRRPRQDRQAHPLQLIRYDRAQSRSIVRRSDQPP
jgi:hypothetical protein